jgi:hypothetical protein
MKESPITSEEKSVILSLSKDPFSLLFRATKRISRQNSGMTDSWDRALPEGLDLSGPLKKFR